MSPTSYQLLYPAVLLDYKGKHYFLYCKLLPTFFPIIFNFHLTRPAATMNPRGFPDNISTCRLGLQPRIHEAFPTILRPVVSDCDQKSTKLSRQYSDLSARTATMNPQCLPCKTPDSRPMLGKITMTTISWRLRP